MNWISTLIVIIGIILLSFSIVTGLLYVIFWAFGPTIFGFTFNLKLAVGVYVVFVLLSSISKK